MLIKASLLLFAAVADAYAVPSSSSDRELVLPSSNTSNYLNGGSIPTEMVRGEIHSYLPVSDIANFASTSRLAYADTELNFTQADSLSYVIDLFAHSDLGPATDVKLINSLTKPPFNQLCLREAKQLVLALHQRGMFSEMISWIQGLGNVTPGGLAHVFSTALFSDFIKLGNEQVLTLFYNTSGRNGTRTVSLLFESALMQGFDNLTQTIIDDGVLPTSK